MVIFSCHIWIFVPPVSRRVPSKFHERDEMCEHACRVPVCTQLQIIQQVRAVLNSNLFKHNEPIFQSMRWRRVTVDERGWLKDANFVLIGRSDLSGVRAAVQCRNADVVVCGSRNDLDTLESACQDDNVATGSVCLRKYKQETH